MTIENTEDTTQVGVSDPADPQALEPTAGSADSVQGSAPRADTESAPIERASSPGTLDSVPPHSPRKLAPPPKPKRDSGAASAPPSRPPGEGPDLLASASALKPPIAPSISFSALADAAALLDTDSWPEPEAAADPEPSLIQPP